MGAVIAGFGIWLTFNGLVLAGVLLILVSLLVTQSIQGVFLQFFMLFCFGIYLAGAFVLSL